MQLCLAECRNDLDCNMENEYCEADDNSCTSFSGKPISFSTLNGTYSINLIIFTCLDLFLKRKFNLTFQVTDFKNIGIVVVMRLLRFLHYKRQLHLGQVAFMIPIVMVERTFQVQEQERNPLPLIHPLVHG